jgi:predicted GNAT family N-acyltransferase
MTATLTVPGAEVVRLEVMDLLELSRLCLRCTAFFELIEGRSATDATAAEILGPLDSAYSHGVRHVWGVKQDGELIAVADLLQGHPDVRDWYIGLLLIDPDNRRKGLGARFCSGILNWINRLNGASVRLIVQQQNARARRFWERQGFELERETLSRSGVMESRVWVLARRGGESGT